MSAVNAILIFAYRQIIERRMVVRELCLEMKVQVCMCVRLSKIHCTVHQIYVALACGLPLSVCVSVCVCVCVCCVNECVV